MKTAIEIEDREVEFSSALPPAGAHRDFTVEVDRVAQAEWSEWMRRFSDANIYQTWAYGEVRWREKNLSHLLLKRGGEVVAMAQLRIMRPGNVRLGAAYLRWGPLCHGWGTKLDPEIVNAMAAALRREYVEKRGLHLEILPNAFVGMARAQIFQSAFAQFDRVAGVGAEQYRTLVLDISPSLEDLRKGLDKKWRNQLNAAERSPLQMVEGADDGDAYRKFAALYTEMQQRKKFYSPVSIGDFERIQAALPEAQKMIVLIGEHEGKPVSGLVCAPMGDSGIYLLGATNDEGMKLKASYHLQWTMIRLLKQRRIRFYDLGGIDPEANPGVYHFKSGLSGADVSHIGSFRACDNPFSKALVTKGQALRDGFRSLRQRLAQPRRAEATR
jgi:lipid II:glycine glycyltransferase (peptidoglycan interpeptide bridge formation enzyme)